MNNEHQIIHYNMNYYLTNSIYLGILPLKRQLSHMTPNMLFLLISKSLLGKIPKDYSDFYKLVSPSLKVGVEAYLKTCLLIKYACIIQCTTWSWKEKGTNVITWLEEDTPTRQVPPIQQTPHTNVHRNHFESPYAVRSRLAISLPTINYGTTTSDLSLDYAFYRFQ